MLRVRAINMKCFCFENKLVFTTYSFGFVVQTQADLDSNIALTAKGFVAITVELTIFLGLLTYTIIDHWPWLKSKTFISNATPNKDAK